MGILGSSDVATDENARLALREFLSAVYEVDGPSEVRRLAEVFSCKLHIEYPVRDFVDNTPDGNLSVPTPLAKTAQR